MPDLNWAPRLDAILKRAGLTNVALADEMGLSDGQVSRFRSGERMPTPDQLAYMIRRAGGSADEVLGIRPLGSVRTRASLRAELLRLAETFQALGEQLVDEEARRK